MHRRGFTLIELLVVIVIISILSAAAVSSFTNSQRRARDARRRSDVKAIQDASEQYYSTCNAYPASAADFVTVTAGCAAGSGIGQFVQAGSGLAYPLDPRSGNTYRVVSASSTAYRVCAQLELTAAGAVNAAWTTTNADDGNDVVNDFCVLNLQ